jgi:lipopolysaccharide/colanic/teichoic acid biosynthesis glycosyltransferase
LLEQHHEMDNTIQDNTNFISDTTAVMPRATVTYGIGAGVDTIPVPRSASVSLSFWTQLQYFFGEYGKGIMFVLASTLFILAVPAVLTRPASLKVAIVRFTKRTIDIFGALVGLLLTVPIWLVIPLLIKLTSRGPVFYTQVRVGRDRRNGPRRFHSRTDVVDRRSRDRRREDHGGSLFQVIKFRTMVHNAEKMTGPVWAAKNDPRITPLGAFLRKTRIDEIPQFVNVLLGHMSLVGPRPERPKFVDEFSEKLSSYSRRLEVKPGITGLAQVEGGYDTSLASVADKLRYDLDYIDNWSLWMDIRIMLKTVLVVLTGRGAQ